jgi:hypothetical protein
LPPFEDSIAAQFPDTSLADVEQVYQTFNMHGCTFYIAGEGEMLRLDDIHVEDHNSGEWRRPVCSGEMPLQAALYQQVPWVKEKHGDYMKMKDDVSEVLKVFLIRRDPVTQILDFDTVVALDAEERAVAREAVVRTTDEADPEQLSLRIREGHITLELTDAMPSFDEVVQAAREQREPEGWSEDPYEAAPADMDDNELDDDFDAPDIPAIDFA